MPEHRQGLVVALLGSVEVATLLLHHAQGAQREGDVAASLDPEALAQFLIANIAGIRVAGRGGADRSTLAALQEMVMRALR